jgi:hypothetical protein
VFWARVHQATKSRCAVGAVVTGDLVSRVSARRRTEVGRTTSLQLTLVLVLVLIVESRQAILVRVPRER